MSTLIVYLNAEKIGRLEEDDSGVLQFSYDQVWLEKPGAPPLSRSLPLQGRIFTGKKARAFFAGILPEEEPRRQIAKILGISDTNDFSIGDWRKMASKTGLGWPMVRERMAENSHAVLNKLDAVQMQTRECGEEMAERLHKIIGYRSAKMLEALSKQEQ